MKNIIGAFIGAAVIGGISYLAGKKNGHNECLYECQQAVVKSIIESEKKEG